MIVFEMFISRLLPCLLTLSLRDVPGVFAAQAEHHPRRQDPSPVPTAVQDCASQSNCLLATSQIQQCLSTTPGDPLLDTTPLSVKIQKCLCDDGGSESYTPWKSTVSSCLSCINSGGIPDSLVNTVAQAVTTFCTSSPPDSAAQAIFTTFFNSGLRNLSATQIPTATNGASFTILIDTHSVTSLHSEFATASVIVSNVTSISTPRNLTSSTCQTQNSSSASNRSATPVIAMPATSTNTGAGADSLRAKVALALVAMFLSIITWLLT